MKKYFISKNLYINTFHFLLTNLLKMELAEQTPNILFGKSKMIDDDDELYFYNFNDWLIVDKSLKMSYAAEQFDNINSILSPNNKFNSNFMFLYTLNLENYIPVVISSGQVDKESSFLKSILKVAGFYILYNFYIKFKGCDDEDKTEPYDIYNFEYILNMEIRLIFQNFGILGGKTKPININDLLMLNSMSTIKTWFRQPIKICVAKSKSLFDEFDTTFLFCNPLDLVTHSIIGRLKRNDTFDDFFKHYFDKDRNIVLRYSSNLYALERAISRLQPVDIGKLVRVYTKSCNKY